MAYESLTTHEIKIEGAAATIINVELTCNLEETRWCMHPDQLKKVEQERERAQAMANVEAAALKQHFDKAKKQAAAAQAAIDHEGWKKHRFDRI